jgi:hypothetical protein
LEEAHLTEVIMNTSYAQQIKVPAFVFENHIVWGATAMMLSELKDVISKVIA